MIERYSRKKMAEIWSQQSKFKCMLDVEKSVARVQAKHKIIPRAAALAIQAKGRFRVEEILEIEKSTKHDVIAFVQNVAHYVGLHGRFVHYGLTSSDVLDTALALQLQQAQVELVAGLDELEKILAKSAQKYAQVLCAGRTHGIHAEVTSFGMKLAGFLMELRRARKNLNHAIHNCLVGKMSGAVGVYTNMSPQLEKEVMRQLKLKAETVATQVIPRDRHAAVFSALAIYGGFLERLAVELRHLQRTEVGEVTESFSKGQKGSSAMPHKKNPISAENLTGVARLLRSYAQAALENMALWHERDISHSSVERVIFPDAFILADYATDRLTGILKGLHVDAARMRENMKLSQGMLMSSQLLVLLLQKGMTREDAYKSIQQITHGLKKQEQLETAIFKHPELKKVLRRTEVQKVFSGRHIQDRLKGLVQRALKEKT